MKNTSLDLLKKTLFIVIVSLLMSLAGRLFAQAPNTAFSKIDAYAIKAPQSATRSTESLAAYLEKGGDSDLEKTRAIFRWITYNVQYDYELLDSLNAGLHPRVTAKKTLSKRKSVCAGYAYLFSQLADHMGLENEIVVGWARNGSRPIGFRFPEADGNHAWNRVKIDGEWILLDACWAARYHKASPNEFYWNTKPTELSMNHLPADPAQNIIKNPLTKKQFEHLPVVYNKFFEMGFTAFAPKKGIMKVKENHFTLFLGNANQMKFKPEVRDAATNLSLEHGWKGKVSQEGNKYKLDFWFKPGQYDLTVKARKDVKGSWYWGVVKYRIIVPGGTAPVASL